MATRRESMHEEADFDSGFEEMEVDVDELLAAIHENQLYEPPRRSRRDRSARRRIESRRERRWLKQQVSDWDSEDGDVGDYDDYEERF